jgi:F-type H+-transporting ATPase subunit b
MRIPRLTASRLLSGSFLGLCALATDVWAGEGKGGFTSAVYWQIVSFVLLIVVLARFVKKPLASFLARRQEEIQNAMAQSAKKKEEAEALLAEWQKKVDSLNREVQDLHQRIREEGEAERKKIVSRAHEESERLRQQAIVIAEQELVKARAALKGEMVDLAVNLAETLLKETLRPQDQERLIQDYIGKVRELR